VVAEVYSWSSWFILGKRELWQAAAMTAQLAERTASCGLQWSVSKPVCTASKELSKTSHLLN